MSISDLGGNHDHFGPIPRDHDAGFAADWERRAFGVTMIAGAAAVGANVDAMRAAMESLPPERYFESYWGRWLGGLEVTLEREGMLARGELEARIAGREPAKRGEKGPTLQHRIMSRLAGLTARPLPRWMLGAAVRVTSGSRSERTAARFSEGDAVRGVATRPAGHTRVPGYACGKRGTIVKHHGTMAFPDTRARFEGDQPQHLYTVRFEGAELWGAEAEPRSHVLVDLFESYLEGV